MSGKRGDDGGDDPNMHNKKLKNNCEEDAKKSQAEINAEVLDQLIEHVIGNGHLKPPEYWYKTKTTQNWNRKNPFEFKRTCVGWFADQACFNSKHRIFPAKTGKGSKVQKLITELVREYGLDTIVHVYVHHKMSVDNPPTTSDDDGGDDSGPDMS